MKLENQFLVNLKNPVIRTGMVLLLIVLVIISCSKISRNLPAGSADNGGLSLPDKFEAVVVVDSIGKARHLAVNENGDIYVLSEHEDIKIGHDEHDVITLPKNEWICVSRQREYDPLAVEKERKVAD